MEQEPLPDTRLCLGWGGAKAGFRCRWSVCEEKRFKSEKGRGLDGGRGGAWAEGGSGSGLDWGGSGLDRGWDELGLRVGGALGWEGLGPWVGGAWAVGWRVHH